MAVWGGSWAVWGRRASPLPPPVDGTLLVTLMHCSYIYAREVVNIIFLIINCIGTIYLPLHVHRSC